MEGSRRPVQAFAERLASLLFPASVTSLRQTLHPAHLSD
jgi:hypothetical protein